MSEQEQLREQNKISDYKFSPAANFLRKNPLLACGLAVSPAVLYADTLENAIILSMFMTLLTFLTLTISSFIPRKIVYTSRVILYTLIGALMFVPIYILFSKIMPEKTVSMGIIAPLLITNPFIVSRSELQFFRESKGKMFADILTTLAGYDIAVIIIGFLRELLSTGGIGGQLYGIKYTFPGLGYPFGGFLIVGLLAAAVRLISRLVRRKSK